MNKKLLFWISFACIALSILVMALPTAYRAGLCLGAFPFSYFDPCLLGIPSFLDDLEYNLFAIAISFVAIVCDAFLLLRFAFKKPTKRPVLIMIIGVGFLTSVFTIIYDYGAFAGIRNPSHFPLVTVILGLACFVLFLLQLFFKKFEKTTIVVTAMGLFASIFSLLKSYYITLPGFVISALFLSSFVCQHICLRSENPSDADPQ